MEKKEKAWSRKKFCAQMAMQQARLLLGEKKEERPEHGERKLVRGRDSRGRKG